ncbi:OmpH family outer membrane protein [Roseinatronobacter alkalisoli]|uniref:OmpH family outer membrane protein n=1 Tax=Roseinatronobacter alkalisoli TaxID=3028235 RepID=A0ABT5T4X5_9RHOB|nr:OmpH family outer membrane protein [Roseinatronobacter sp. HJB301]MDD7970104.1 OmpH family outer membrane protein [Roseinatronobacter sp. HJB301]
MMRPDWVLAWIGAAGIQLAAPGFAQGTQGFPLGQSFDEAAPTLQLRTLNEERLFRDSAFGQRVAAEIDAASRALELENEELLEQLTTRELELTEARATMPPVQFRAAAEAFDREAEAIRRSQAEKRQRLSMYEDAEQRRFFQLAAPVLQQVLVSEGAQVLIDSRAVIIGVSGMDMTDPSIAALNEGIGDGAPSPTPLRVP